MGGKEKGGRREGEGILGKAAHILLTPPTDLPSVAVSWIQNRRKEVYMCFQFTSRFVSPQRSEFGWCHSGRRGSKVQFHKGSCSISRYGQEEAASTSTTNPILPLGEFDFICYYSSDARLEWNEKWWAALDDIDGPLIVRLIVVDVPLGKREGRRRFRGAAYQILPINFVMMIYILWWNVYLHIYWSLLPKNQDWHV